jgi:hypothetical protein
MLLPSRNLLFDFVAEASRNSSIRKSLSETYEQNINLLADFLANQNPSLKQKPEESRQAVALLSPYVCTMVSSILGAKNDDLKQAWQQATSDIVHHKI